MRTKPPELRRIASTAAFAVACIAILIAGWLSFGGTTPLTPRGYQVVARFDEARGLQPGADVRVAGVKIGRVVNVSTVGGDADVRFELDPERVPLRSGAKAILRTKTLLGEAFLELALGPKGAPAIPEGGRLPERNVQDNQQLDEVLSTFSPPTRRNTRELLRGLAAAYDGRAAATNDALGLAAPTASSAREVLQALDEQRPQLQQLIADAGSVLSVFGERQGSLQASLDAGNRFLAATGARERSLRATVRAIPPFLDELKTTSVQLTALAPELNAGARALQRISPDVQPALRAIEVHAPTFERTFRQLTPTARTAIAQLPRLERIARAAPPALRETYPALRELIPVMALLAADRLDLIGILANLSNVTNPTAVGPGGAKLPLVSGLPTIWNEVIGGYKKKLPTNRPNPYPKPGALKMKPRGYLQSFQCRHTGNRLLLPPTGSGVPPCDVQGPWTFNGRSAAYPVMTKAAP